jgi:hypothetical protein
MATTDDDLFEVCMHCHLFVEDAHPFPAHPEQSVFFHLHSDSEADRKLDESHEATPSGMFATLVTWRTFGPRAMRERFTDMCVRSDLTADKLSPGDTVRILTTPEEAKWGHRYQKGAVAKVLAVENWRSIVVTSIHTPVGVDVPTVIVGDRRVPGQVIPIEELALIWKKGQ